MQVSRASKWVKHPLPFHHFRRSEGLYAVCMAKVDQNLSDHHCGLCTKNGSVQAQHSAQIEQTLANVSSLMEQLAQAMLGATLRKPPGLHDEPGLISYMQLMDQRVSAVEQFVVSAAVQQIDKKIGTETNDTHTARAIISPN